MLRATRTTAALTGAWSVLGFGALLAWEQRHTLDISTHNAAFVACALLFFFVPGAFFVLGLENLRLRDTGTRMYGQFRQACLRVLFWVLGAAAFAIAYVPFLSRLA